MNQLISTNPSRNYTSLGGIAVSTKDEVSRKVASAHKTQISWRKLSIKGRVELLQKVVARFEQVKRYLLCLWRKKWACLLRKQ